MATQRRRADTPPPQFSRRSEVVGLAKKANPGAIDIIYDAELAEPKHGWCGCNNGMMNKERSYLYIRENSVETNVAVDRGCCGCGKPRDNVKVMYFDRHPFLEPAKLEILETGFMCCFHKFLCGEKLVVMPFERLPFPCCCQKNRTKGFCCGACGPIAGNPSVFEIFQPQPQNPEEFLTMLAAAREIAAPPQTTMN